MKTREYQCIYYEFEGSCLKGHDGTFNKQCQTCKDYQKKKGSQPRRKNLKKEKVSKWLNDIKNYE